MNDARAIQCRLAFTTLVLLLELLHLTWEYFHGGVASHHLLNRADLPSISNYWGVILLPALTWFVTGRITSRLANTEQWKGKFSIKTWVIVGLLSALLVGGALSWAFTQGFDDLASFIFIGIFVAGLLAPVYRAECILGFVLGMTFTFGAILPLLVASVIAITSGIAHRGFYPLVRWGWRRMVSVGA